MATIKIKINENESYTINLEKEEIEADEFVGFLERLKDIERVLLKSAVIGGKIRDINKKHYSRGHRRLSYSQDRNKILEALRIKYHGTAKEKEEIAKAEGLDYNTFSKILIYQMHKHFINPKEIGLKEFPHGKEEIKKIIEKEQKPKKERAKKYKPRKKKAQEEVKKNGNGDIDKYNDRN